MPTSVPTAAEFDALAARVSKLEGGAAPGPTPGQPSKTGTYITKPSDPPILDDALNAWSLVASGGQQIAVQRTGTQPPAMIDAVTANVTKLGIDLVGGHRQVVQQNQAGNFYTTTAPFAPWNQITGPDGYVPPPIPAGSVFKVSGGNLHKPDGSLFKPTGIDLWWASMSNTAPPTGWNQADQVISNWTTGAPMLAAFPDMNTIRLACFMDDFPTVAQLKPLVDFCTAHRIVLIIDAHDYSGGSNWVYSYGDGSLQKAVAFFQAHGAAWKGNPWVMFQTENEPGTPNSDEMNALYDAVRGQGNETPIFLSWVTWGYTDRVDHNIAQRMHNVCIDLHCYAMGAGSNNMDINAHLAWIANTTQSINSVFKSADGEIPIMCLEFGDACCGAVEQAGLIACEAVVKSAFKGWTIWNWTTDWNHSWGVDVINNGALAVKGGAVVKPYMIKG